jgi:Cu-processing system permease protein
VLTLFVMLFLMTAIFFVIYFLHALKIEWSMLTALLYIFLELCLITAVALFFSCFSTPILSSIFSLAFYFIGHLSWGLETLIKKMEPGAGKAAAQILYTFLPDLENFNFKTEIVHHLLIPPQALLYSAIYGIFYTVFVLFLAILVFRKRDFI